MLRGGSKAGIGWTFDVERVLGGPQVQLGEAECHLKEKRYPSPACREEDGREKT